MREERLRAFNEAMASFAKELQDRLSFLRRRLVVLLVGLP